MDTSNEIGFWMKVTAGFGAAGLWLWKNVLVPFHDVKRDISAIKENHMAHLQTYAEEIRDLKQRDIEREGQHHEVIERLSRIEGIVSQK